MNLKCFLDWHAWDGYHCTTCGKLQNGSECRMSELMIAAKGHESKSTKLILDAGTRVNLRCDLGRTAIFYACSNCHLRYVDNGANTDFGIYRYLRESNSQILEVVRYLLEAGANVNIHDKYGETPLMAAAASGNLTVVELLLARGANVTAKDMKGHTALDHARIKMNSWLQMNDHDLSNFGFHRFHIETTYEETLKVLTQVAPT